MIFTTDDPRQHRRTDPLLFAWLNRRYQFQVDLAASEENALCDKFVTEEMDFFSKDWLLEFDVYRGFLNPEWSMASKFLEHAYRLSQNHIDNIVCVVIHATWAKRVAPWLQKAFQIEQLVGRPQFLVDEGWWVHKKGTCQNRFGYDLPRWEDPNTKAAPCPDCGDKLEKVENSTNPRDVQVVTFTHDSFMEEVQRPNITFVDWRKNCELLGVRI